MEDTDVKVNKIDFSSDIKNVKVASNGKVTIQIDADIDEIDMNLLSLIMTGAPVRVHLESNQTELLDDKEAEGQTELLGEDDQ